MASAIAPHFNPARVHELVATPENGETTIAAPASNHPAGEAQALAAQCPNPLRPAVTPDRGQHSDLRVHQPVLIGEAGAILAGHGRAAAAKLLGIETVPCRRIANMTPEQKRACVLLLLESATKRFSGS